MNDFRLEKSARDGIYIYDVPADDRCPRCGDVSAGEQVYLRLLRNETQPLRSCLLSVVVLAALAPVAHATPIGLFFSSQTSVTINGFVDLISGTFTLDPSLTGTGVSDVLAANILVSSGDPELVGDYGITNPCVSPETFPGCVDTQDFNQIARGIRRALQVFLDQY